MYHPEIGQWNVCKSLLMFLGSSPESENIFTEHTTSDSQIYVLDLFSSIPCCIIVIVGS